MDVLRSLGNVRTVCISIQIFSYIIFLLQNTCKNVRKTFFSHDSHLTNSFSTEIVFVVFCPLGVVSEKKPRYLLSLSKKGGRVITHDQIRKQIKMWSRGVGQRALINLIMLEFSKQILNSMRNIYIFTLFLQKFQVINVIQQ